MKCFEMYYSKQWTRYDQLFLKKLMKNQK